MDLNTGGLNWVFKTHCLDIVDHSITFGGKKAKTGIFHPNGPNQDATHGAIFVTHKDIKYIVCSNKSRTFILDPILLKNSLTHTLDDTTPDYKKGILNNVSQRAVVYKDTIVNFCNNISFAGCACDGTTYVRRFCNWGKPTPFMAFEDNTIEKQGILANGICNDTISTYPDTGSRSTIYAYDIPNLIEHYLSSKLNTLDKQKDNWKWVRVLNERVGSCDVGSVQIYGKSVVTGSNGGVLYILDVETGNISSTIKNYEGMSAGPVIANGIMYGYGGNNKWNTSKETRFGTYIWMATPDGK